jgi:hypothetical protein
MKYKELIGKRVVLITVGDDTSTLIPGIASVEDGVFWVGEVGIGLDEFEDDMIFPLEERYELRKKFNVAYMVVVR